jgi:hypothetical protein
MRTLRLFLATLLAASGLIAQTSTSPRGLDTTEGNAAFAHWSSTRRLQGIDNGWFGTPRVVRSIGWRRNGAGGGSPGTFDVKVTMGECYFGLVSAEFALNLQSNAALVFNATSVNFPNWSAAANPPPAAFDFVLTFTRPWVYTGRAALVWDIEYSNAVSTSGSTDRDYTGATTTASGTVLGAGCNAYAHDMRLENNGPALSSFSMRFRVNGTSGPANSPTLLLIDTQDRNLAVPTLCTTLHCLPNILLQVGTTDATGTLNYVNFSFPYLPGLQSMPFVTQLVSFDPSQAPKLPFRLSNGRQATMPTSSQTAGHQAVYLWNTLPNNVAISGFTFFGGSVIVELKT